MADALHGLLQGAHFPACHTRVDLGPGGSRDIGSAVPLLMHEKWTDVRFCREPVARTDPEACDLLVYGGALI